MLFLVVCCVALVLGIVIGLVMVHDQGYVLIAYGNTTIETSVWAIVVLLLILLLLLYGGVKVLWSVMNGRSALNRWRAKRQQSRTRDEVSFAMYQAEVGTSQSAVDALRKSAEQSDAGPLVLLEAARMAARNGNRKKSSTLFDQIRTEYPTMLDVADLAQAELAITDGSGQSVLDRLRELVERQPRSVHAWRLLIQGYDQIEDLESLHDAFSRLRQIDASAAADLLPIERKSWVAQFEQMDPTRAADQSLSELWGNVPKQLRRDQEIVSSYTDALARHDNHKEAVAMLSSSLKHAWHKRWVQSFGTIVNDAAAQLQQAEQWLKTHPNDAALLVTLGRLSMALDHEEQAREYFEQSLRVEPSDDARTELARLLLRQKDYERSLLLLESKTPVPVGAAHG